MVEVQDEKMREKEEKMQQEKECLQYEMNRQR